MTAWQSRPLEPLYPVVFFDALRVKIRDEATVRFRQGIVAVMRRLTAWLVLVRFLQERYAIAADNIYAHNWIDFKDSRYCEGCDLASAARKLRYEPGRTAVKLNSVN